MGLTIGVLGLAGSGKDTFAQMLLKYLEDYSIDRYAAPIKELTCKVFGLNAQEVEDRVLKEQAQVIDPDNAVEECLHVLTKVLRFSDEELEQASELYFDLLSHKTVISPRAFQQIFGTDIVRAVRSDAWVQRLQRRDVPLIVPDVRFANELCDYNILIMRGNTTPKPTHSSEVYAWQLQYDPTVLLNTMDYHLMNDSTLEALEKHAQLCAYRLTSQQGV